MIISAMRYHTGAWRVGEEEVVVEVLRTIRLVTSFSVT
jgi:hypothetical protein